MNTIQMETTTKKRTPRSTDSAHYVNNEEFLAALIEHKNKIKEASTLGLEKPQVSNYLGDCFLKIATHLSYKGNFVGYSYRDDMISDGIENCLVAADKFDPDKSSNPFAYYTQIIYFAFVRRIQKEKKQQATKYKMLENVDLDQLLAHSDGNEEYVNRIIDLMQKQMDTIESDRKTV